MLQVYDVDNIMGLVQSENIQVHAEAYDVALDMSFPKGRGRRNRLRRDSGSGRTEAAVLAEKQGQIRGRILVSPPALFDTSFGLFCCF